MKTAAATLNLALLAMLALPAWLVFDAMARQPGQTWQGMAFAGLVIVAAAAWGLAAVLICRPEPARASPLVSAGCLAALAAVAVAFVG